MKAKVCRYYYDAIGPKGWYVAVYWTYDHEECPHDYDLYLTPAEWRKWSGLPSPKKGYGLEVEIGVKQLREFKVRDDDEK